MANIRKEISKSKIVLDSITKTSFQKPGTLTAQIRQTVTVRSFYPSKKVENDLSANIFDATDFGFAEQEFTSEEQRVAWILVPPSVKAEDVQAKLDAAFAKGGCIYRVLSSKPILSDDQEYAIKQGLKSMDDFANSQVVRYPDNEQTQANGTANSLVLDANGNPQYRRTFYWNSKMEDKDVRSTTDVYLSKEIEAELQGASVLKGQTI